eukprot:g7281.t1
MCVDCPNGKYQKLEGAPYCEAITPCEPGTYRASGTDPNNRTCVDCPAGSWCSLGYRNDCGGAGLFCPPKSAAPIAAAVGHYTTPESAPEARRSGQTRCTEGWYCQRGLREACPSSRLCVFEAGRTATLSRAASDGGELEEETVQITAQDRCPDGFFAYGGTECVPCPAAGAKCSDGAIELQPGFWYDAERHGDLAGFWRRRQQVQAEAEKVLGAAPPSAGIYRCPEPTRCRVHNDTGAPICLDHHGGPLCSVCDDGYYLAGRRDGCQKCPGGGETAASVFVFLLMVAALWKAALYTWARIKSKYPGLDLTKLTYEMPQILKRFLWHTLTVFFVILFLFGWLVLSEYKAKERGITRQSRARLWNVLLPFLFLVYPSVSNTVVLMLRCVTIDGGKYLLADYSVRCDVPSYDSYRSLAIFFVFLYPVGIPALFTFVLAKNRDKLPPDWWPENIHAEEGNEFTRFRNIKGNEWVERREWREAAWVPRMQRYEKYEQRFGFLFNAYRADFWWFEAVMLLYKLAMTTLIVFVAGADGPDGTTLKILYSMFMATSLIALVAYLQPYKDADVLSVEAMVNLEILFVLFSALYLTLVESAANAVWTGLFLIVLILIPLIAVITLLVRSGREELLRLRSGSAVSNTSSGPTASSPALLASSPAKKGTFRPASKRMGRMDTQMNLAMSMTNPMSQRNMGGQRRSTSFSGLNPLSTSSPQGGHKPGAPAQGGQSPGQGDKGPGP